MSVAEQLHQLQDIDLELSANEQAQVQARSQLGESREIARVREGLAVEKDRLEELQRGLHSAEWEVDSIAVKLTATEGNLFGGTINNPKELSSLQREAEELKNRQGQAENRVLEAMEGIEVSNNAIATSTAELGRLEEEWREQQAGLTTELERLQKSHAELSQNRESFVAGIAAEALEVYQRIKVQKGTAVARVEQGTCRGCRITLPTAELQRARAGGLVRCSSCGRILFLA